MNIHARGVIKNFNEVSVGPRCFLSIEEKETSLNLSINKLVVQTDGRLQLLAENGEVVVNGVSMDVRGGARVSRLIKYMFYLREGLFHG